MNKKYIAIIIAAIVLVGGIAIWNVNKPDQLTGGVVLRGESFKGVISNTAVTPMTIKGMGVYDRSCIMGVDGLTSCDAGVQTQEFGVLNFKYRHNMVTQPCIAPNDLVQVRILDDKGNAEIQRMA